MREGTVGSYVFSVSVSLTYTDLEDGFVLSTQTGIATQQTTVGYKCSEVCDVFVVVVVVCLIDPNLEN